MQPMRTRKTDEASSSSSSCSSSKRWRYDVFISFRGEDTRKNFTGHLYVALKEAGINTFIDDDELRRGEDIGAELVRAIQGSRISVIIFSSRYADSGWCLEELVKIMECKRTLGQIVLPIFYDVDPSDVRKQTGSFAQSFHKHRDTDHNKVQRWRAALHEAANLSGWDLRNTLDGHEANFIRNIIKEITRRFNNTYLHVAPYQVGIDFRVQAISECLGVGFDDVRIIGISGMGGMGKTTVAKAIYNEFYDRFDGKSFLERVREKQLVGLQKQLLFDILKPTKIKVSSVAEGINVIGKRLGSLKVLLIVDDIDSVEQLDALAIKHDTFGQGSRIIITTRDEHLLNTLEVDQIYRVQPMEEEEALELLSWHAFKNGSPNQGYFKLAREVVDYCGGLPLALQVLGCFLGTRSIGEWESTLGKLKKIPCHEIHNQLKISYDGLSDDYERDIFRDIACFFIGMDKNYVTQILDGCGFFAEIGIKVLLERCLVFVDEKNKLMMHDLLRDMGREIERAESPKYPGKRRRLWHPEDVKSVLINKSGTEEIEGLALNLPSTEETSFSTEAFTNMKRLRLLKLNYVQLTGEYKYLSKNLRWLCWYGFPLEFIPKDLCQTNIVAIDMQYTSLRQVLCTDSELLEKLKILNLSHSHYLTQSPDFSKLPNLENLILKDCKSLSKVHKSIGDLKNLTLVNLKDCQMLKGLPKSFYKLKSVRTIVLNGCSRFEILDEKLGKLVSLTTFLADKTAITSVPSSIVRLKKLEQLSLCELKRSLQLPPSGLSNLTTLSLDDCNLTDDAIDSMNLGSLSSLCNLGLRYNHFHTLPSLSGLAKLENLYLDHCTNLREIKDLPTGMENLFASHCTALERIPKFSEMPLENVEIDDSPKLIEFPGLDRALNLGMSLSMKRRNNISDILLEESMLQGWNGPTQLILGGSDIPQWFKHVGEGGQVHFEVPLGCSLTSLAICMVYCSCDAKLTTASFCVINHTKCASFVAKINFLVASSEDFLWLGHLSNYELNLEGGDSVDVLAEIPGFWVKKIGIRLVNDKFINEKDSFDICYSIPYLSPQRRFSVDVDDDDDNKDDEDNESDDDDDDEDEDEDEDKDDNNDDDDNDDDDDDDDDDQDSAPPKNKD
ncbi:Hypothetical predicted protein [Prunus dulcis]|uniref:TIR domain-containing protein n=1 Tax=Prunus dulcis TaxID=3755 RepID=A0A5E4EXM1_PRUDU|nr:Hypothetical predicted protein [Prunus dulcis]